MSYLVVAADRKGRIVARAKASTRERAEQLQDTFLRRGLRAKIVRLL